MKDLYLLMLIILSFMIVRWTLEERYEPPPPYQNFTTPVVTSFNDRFNLDFGDLVMEHPIAPPGKTTAVGTQIGPFEKLQVPA